MTDHDRNGRFRFSVTEADISKATKNHSVRCMVAQTIARTLPDANRIEVDNATIRWSDGKGERFVFVTPYSVQGYIVAFDAGDTIIPFGFALDIRKRIWHKKPGERTEAGRVRTRATNQVRAAKTKQAKVAEGIKTGKLPPEELPKVEAEVAEAVAARTKAWADTSHQPKTLPRTGEGASQVPRAMPRVHRTNQRAYGGRIMRVNQASAGSGATQAP